MWDDARGVRPIPKLAIATAGGVALWLVGIQADVTSSVALNFFITILWVAGITQALNIIDNMDGVAIGLAAIGAIGVFAVAGMTGQSRVASLAIATAGAAIGLIPFNYRPNGERATIFLGDAGTLFLGFTLASMTLALDLPGTPTAVRLAIPILMLAVPLFNVGLVVVARIRDGRPIMTGGTDGIAHRVVDLGLSHRTTAIVFWSIGAACAAAGVYVADRVSVELAVVALTVPGAAAVFGIWFFERTQARPGAYRASAAERKTS
jgi:UDP-GlcNAc:undecaprenyl-phosphate GlcNAc-1-phosphate transferase